MSLALAALVAGGCAHGEKKTAATTPPPAPLHQAVAQLQLHWNDAGDTTRTLKWPGDQPFRTCLTITGVKDSIAGIEVQFRLEPTTPDKGSAWQFANAGGCLAAVWSGTVEPDPKARAPWPHKLAITDVRPQADGTTVFVVSATFDYVKLNPDSTYSVDHMNFQPPQAASDTSRCAGWDVPMRLYVESAQILYTQNYIQPVFDLGKAIFFEPQAAR